LMPTSSFTNNGNLADLQLFGTYASGANGTAAPVQCSPNGGHFAHPTRIRLSCPTTSCTIYYTLDGTTPTTSSTQYTGPFVLSTSSVLNAIASGPNVANSSVTTFYLYVQNEWNITDPQFDVNRNYPWQRNGVWYFYDPIGGYWWMTGPNHENSPTYYTVSPCYRSADFLNWEYTGPQVGVGPAPGALNGTYTGKTYAPNPVWNSNTNQYCALVRNPLVSLGFYTSPNPNGPWTLQHLYTGNINGLSFIDPDNKLFLDSTTNTLYLTGGTGGGASTGYSTQQMNSDFLTFTTTFSSIPSASWTIQREGWNMCEYQGNYFLLFSEQTIWDPNLNEYVVQNTPLISNNSTIVNPFQPWSGAQIPFHNTGSNTPSSITAFDSQVDQIVNIPGRNAYIYVGNRYDTHTGNDFSNCRTILLPIVFPTSSSMTISWQTGNSWSLDTVFPTVSGAPVPPSNLVVTGNSLATWTNNEPRAVNLYLDTASNSAFTSNVVSESLTPMDGATTTQVSSFNISFPNTYYRIRAVNANGSSDSGVTTNNPPAVFTSIVASSDPCISLSNVSGALATQLFPLATLNAAGFLTFQQFAQYIGWDTKSDVALAYLDSLT
jgi:hypothetical protein